jgi:hypothetical protein
MSRERSEEIMRRYLNEVLIQRKLDVIKEIAVEDMWDHTQPKPGRNGLERHAGGFVEHIKNLRIVVNHIIGNDDTVIGVWTWRGNPASAFLGISAGREVECRVTSEFKIRNGLLADYTLHCWAKTTSEPIEQGGMSNMT